MEWQNLQATSQASFYGKAKVLLEGDFIYLKSYNTIVAAIDISTPDYTFTRLWKGYSVTTLKHINDFRQLYNLPAINKKEWLELPCFMSDPEPLYRVIIRNGYYSHKQQALFTEKEAEKEVERLEALYQDGSRPVYIDYIEA